MKDSEMNRKIKSSWVKDGKIWTSEESVECTIRDAKKLAIRRIDSLKNDGIEIIRIDISCCEFNEETWQY